MKPAQEKWLHKVYPLIDLGMSRMACIRWLRERGYPEPLRSACIGCPLHTVGEWRRMRKDDPASFADAVEVDEAIRCGLVGGITARQIYLHARGVPLVDAVEDTTNQTDMFEVDPMENECDGMCGL